MSGNMIGYLFRRLTDSRLNYAVVIWNLVRDIMAFLKVLLLFLLKARKGYVMFTLIWLVGIFAA